jgi:branched-chain amino acid aminotransferase
MVFGRVFAPLMLEIDFDADNGGWGAPYISPFHNLSLSPAATVFHYGVEIFEGMKAYLDDEDHIRLFRPMMNTERFNRSGQRVGLPAVDPQGLLDCIVELLKLSKEWIPKEEGFSLYIRPTMISTHSVLGIGAVRQAKIFVILSPSGPYFGSGFKAVKLLAQSEYARACKGGVGWCKCGGNYAATIAPQVEAKKLGCDQILWLDPEDKSLTEVGAMNFFSVILGEDGVKTLVTAPLNGVILPGVTRASILEIARGRPDLRVEERPMIIDEFVAHAKAGRVLEAFGCGTAAVVSAVRCIRFEDIDYDIPCGDAGIGPITRSFYDEITTIQVGRNLASAHADWSVVID